MSVLLLPSASPFYTIRNCYERLPQTLFYNSHFSYSFTNIIVSRTNNQKTTIKNSAFSFTLDSPIKFTSESIENNFTPFNSNCSFDTETPIGGKTIDGDMLRDSHNIFFIDNCGDIVITGCTFNNCYSNGPGGSIFILQNCSVIIHNTIFNSSHTSNITGGAIYAARDIGGKIDYNNGEIQQLDIQYCCFQNCYGLKDNSGISPLYGIAIFSSAINNILYYASTVNCPGENGIKATGAQFDLQGTNLSSKFVNSTGGYSDYCGGIEYRHAKDGFFRFQTISDMKCMFSVSYTDISSKKIELSLSNIFNVTIERGQLINDERVYSGLIHIRKTHEIEIINFSFIDNILEDTKFQQNGQTYTDFAKIISRGTNNNGLQHIDITLIDCYYSCQNDKLINSSNYVMETISCHPGANADDLNDIPQLDLGECKGKVTAKPLTPTYAFTDSKYFTESKGFTDSKYFTESNEFSQTDDFTNSKSFTASDEFTKSSQFTHLSTFSNSDEFTQSFGFAPSIGIVDSTKKDGVNVGMIAGIAAGAAAVSAAAAAAVIFFVKRARVGAPVEADTINNATKSVNNENPLYSKEAEDDPFKDDFAV